MNGLNTSGLDKMTVKHSAKEHVSKEQIVAWIVEKVQSLPNPDALKFNVELILYISSCIEIACKDNSIKTDKLEIFMGVYKRLFDLTTQDEVVLVQMLEFLHKNSLIKGKVASSVYSFLKKGVVSFLTSAFG